MARSAKPQRDPASNRMTDLLQNPAPPPVRKTHAKASTRVVFACILAMLLFVGAVVLLFQTWLPRQNPNTMIVIQGDERFDGAIVTVNPAAPGVEKMTATITSEDNYRLRFHLPPGAYTVAIRLNGQVFSVGTAMPGAATPAYMRTSELKLPTTRRGR
jgi:hypothetical protein